MPSKIDGTNGVLQAYDYQTPTTGFSYTFAAGTQTLVMNPAGTLATGTITMPASPADGMTITFSSTKTITALTVNGNTGQTIVSAPTVLPANQAASYVYRLSNTTWYPYETVPTNVPVTPAGGSAVTSGTSVASTSGTAIDFTSIPSWVKRITVMFSNVSTTGSSAIVAQLGTSGGVATTGYGSGSEQGNAGLTPRVSTTYFFVTGASSAGGGISGHIVLTNISGNTWVQSGLVIDSVNGTSSGSLSYTFSAGSVALSGTLDRVRLTTAGGTDTFDAGSINILYE